MPWKSTFEVTQNNDNLCPLIKGQGPPKIKIQSYSTQPNPAGK